MIRLRWVAVAAAGSLIALAAGCSSDGEDSPAPAHAEAPRSFFGVVPQSDLTPDDVVRMGQGKVGTIRLVVPWQLIEPKGPQLEPAYLDQVVLEAARQRIEVLPTLSGTPDWVAQDLDDDDCTLDCSNYPPRGTEALAAWGDFVGKMVDRYGPGGELWRENPDVDPNPIHDWQIWNEQNSPTYFQPKPDPAVYENLLDPAAQAIHSRDPEGSVILGGMFISPLKGRPPAYLASDFLRRLYAIPGARESFDAVAVHPYSAHLSKIRLQVSLMHDEIERADDDAGIWITEVGASSSDADNPLDRGPAGQADVLREAFDLFLEHRRAWDIEAVTWYSWRDATEAQCEWCQYSGLFPANSLEDPKPAWDVFVGYTGGT